MMQAKGGELADEQSPLAFNATPGIAANATVYTELERRLPSSGIEAVILRYGFFYGPETWYAPDGRCAEIVRQRQYPIIGQGTAVWSWIHIDDAVEATVAALSLPTVFITSWMTIQPSSGCGCPPSPPRSGHPRPPQSLSERRAIFLATTLSSMRQSS
jgi:hypothetical protein